MLTPRLDVFTQSAPLAICPAHGYCATMLTNPTSDVTFFFDGACPLCSREARHYDTIAKHGQLTLVNIAASDFDANAHGLDAVAVHKTLHAKLKDGTVVTGIDAFAHIWRLFPKYRPLAILTTVPGMRQVMQLGYAAFAKVRPRLPGRSQSCKKCHGE